MGAQPATTHLFAAHRSPSRTQGGALQRQLPDAINKDGKMLKTFDVNEDGTKGAQTGMTEVTANGAASLDDKHVRMHTRR